jgi:2-polyprenyl-6-methoxyphenol hydroxylase-like FAD-dependent oxidoreductase
MSTDEIVIVGAGPTGLTLACQLLRRGVPCTVIDGAATPSDRSRAIGVSARSMEVLDELGAADDLIARGVRCTAAVFYSAGRPIGRVTPAAARHTRFTFMLAVPQSETEAVLEQALHRLGGKVERGHRLTGLAQSADGVTLTVDGPDGTHTRHAHWVVGADGSRSTTRELAGIGVTGAETGEVYVNVDAHVENGPDSGAGHYHFSPGAMTVIVPLAGGMHRVTAMVDPGQNARTLTVEEVDALVAERTGQGMRITELRNPGWGIAKVRIHTHIADTFRAGRVLLAGDAAHTYGPVGGQGMNGGIQDAHNLGWKLALVATARAGADLISTYDTERRPAAHAALHHAATQARLGTIRPSVVRSLRDVAVRALTATGLLDRKMAPTITQLDLDYAGSAGVAKGAGKRLPDTVVADGTMFSRLRSDALTVLVLDPHRAAPRSLTYQAATLRDHIGDTVAVEPVWRDTVDVDGELHARLGTGRPRVCVVRPDAHVSYLGPLADQDALREHLRVVLGAPERSPAGHGLPITRD